MTESPSLPDHIEETIRAIAKLHADHHQQATALQRITDRMTAMAGNPGFIGVVTLGSVLWIVVNLALAWSGGAPPDPPPFPRLTAVASVLALYLTALILATQRRDDQLAARRDQLTLELALIADHKTAKIIELLEEFRRDSPLTRDRADDQARAMSVPANPQDVLDAIDQTHRPPAAPEAPPGAPPKPTP